MLKGVFFNIDKHSKKNQSIVLDLLIKYLFINLLNIKLHVKIYFFTK